MSRIEGSSSSPLSSSIADAELAPAPMSTQGVSSAAKPSGPTPAATGGHDVVPFQGGGGGGLLGAVMADHQNGNVLSGALLALSGPGGQVLEALIEMSPLYQLLMGGHSQRSHGADQPGPQTPASAPGAENGKKPGAAATASPSKDAGKKPGGPKGPGADTKAPAPNATKKKDEAAGAGTTKATDASKAPTTPREFPKTADGTPRFSQSDPEWANTKMFEGRAKEEDKFSISQRGCAVTSVSMALSKATGHSVTPKDLDAQLDALKGYTSSDTVVWDVAAKAFGAKVTVSTLDLDALGAALRRGESAVISVNSSGSSKTTEHWVILTGQDPKNPDRFFGVDPAGAGLLTFEKNADGILESTTDAPINGKKHYLTTNAMRVFTKG